MNLFKRLVGTRDNILEVCDEYGIPVPEEGTLGAFQCVNCSIWAASNNIILEDDIPVCGFCHDMNLLRF